MCTQSLYECSKLVVVFIAGTWDKWQPWSECIGPTQIRARRCTPKLPCCGSSSETTLCAIGKFKYAQFRTLGNVKLQLIKLLHQTIIGKFKYAQFRTLGNVKLQLIKLLHQTIHCYNCIQVWNNGTK